MNESEKQFSFTRAASRTSGRAKNQIPINQLSREKVLGPEYPDTLGSVTDLAKEVFRKTRGFSDAITLLRNQGAKPPRCLAGIRYNLACVECLSGNLGETKRLIAGEIAAKAAAREQALKDDDLKAIHDYIRDLAPAQTSPNIPNA